MFMSLFPISHLMEAEGVGRMKNYIKRLWDDDQGQSTTEYILILSVVVMVAMKFKSTFQAKLTGILDNVGGQIDQATSSNN